MDTTRLHENKEITGNLGENRSGDFGFLVHSVMQNAKAQRGRGWWKAGFVRLSLSDADMAPGLEFGLFLFGWNDEISCW